MDECHREERADKIAAAFGLVTAKLKDAASLAAEGQGPRPDAEHQSLAGEIGELTNDVAIVVGLLEVLLHPD